MMSPAQACSTILRSLAISCWGWERRTFFPPCICHTSMPASNSPEQIRMNAIRSRWALFMLAWILKTKAEKSGSTMGSISPLSDILGRGGVVIFRKCSRKVSTPKLVKADPKNTGDSSPLLTSSWSKAAPAPSCSSISSSSWTLWESVISQEISGSPISTFLTSPWMVPSGYLRRSPPSSSPGRRRPGIPCRSQWAS